MAAIVTHEPIADNRPLMPVAFIVGPLAAVVGIMAIFPQSIMRLVFGDNFHQSGQLLALYAALTGIYALAVTLITFEMSRKIANTGWLQLLFSGMLVLGISLFHTTLRDVALVQLVLMLLLLAIVSAPFVRNHRRGRAAVMPLAGEGSV